MLRQNRLMVLVAIFGALGGGCTEPIARDDSCAVLVRGYRVDACTGRILGEVERETWYDIAEPTGQVGVYRLGSRLIAADTGEIIGRPGREFKVTPNRLRRIGDNGETLWSVPVKWTGTRANGPAVVPDGNRVFIQAHAGITALDRTTGETLWQSSRPDDRLFASNGLVLAVDNGNYEHKGRKIVARSQSDGRKLFTVPLSDRSNTEPIQRIADLYLVTEQEWEGGGWISCLFDAKGHVRFHGGEHISGGISVGEDVVLVSVRRLFRLRPDGTIAWQRERGVMGAYSDGTFVRLGGGDLVGCFYMVLADSGCRIIRLHPEDGRVVWARNIEPLGTSHSIYFHHAHCEVRCGKLAVISQGNSGDFLEWADLETGKQLDQWTYDHLTQGQAHQDKSSPPER